MSIMLNRTNEKPRSEDAQKRSELSDSDATDVHCAGAARSDEPSNMICCISRVSKTRYSVINLCRAMRLIGHCFLLRKHGHDRQLRAESCHSEWQYACSNAATQPSITGSAFWRRFGQIRQLQLASAGRWEESLFHRNCIKASFYAFLQSVD
jgi:hypothetical protein